jgi:hypothetical protein
MAKLALLFLILASPFLILWAPFDWAQEIWLILYAPYAMVMLGVLYKRPIRELKVWIFLIPIIFIVLSISLVPLWMLVTEGYDAASQVLLLSLVWVFSVAPIVSGYSILCALLFVYVFKRSGLLRDTT